MSNGNEINTTEMVTHDRRMRDLIQLAKTVASSKATVLIQGEAGTGKESIAHVVHECSSRAQKPLIIVNCSDVPSNLLESELFGYEKGAFGGAATAKAGKFEAASGGTLLLKGVSGLTAALQTKLLHALQESEIYRIGGASPIQIDVRVIATSEKNLAELVSQGEFREDLFFRLNVVNLTLPPLRERLGDIRIVSQHLMTRFAHQHGVGVVGFQMEAMQILESHLWPGNTTELQGVIERAVLSASGSFISSADIVIERREAPRPVAPPSITPIDRKEMSTFMSSALAQSMATGDPNWAPGQTLEDIERTVILNALRYHNGNRTHTAKALGISIRTLRNKLADYRLLGIHA